MRSDQKERKVSMNLAQEKNTWLSFMRNGLIDQTV